MGRSYKTEAVVLRSFRLGEADRVLHIYTLERGRIGAVAKGIRKTKSRFGARLEPLSHFQLKLLWLSGYLPHLTSCAECGTESETLVGYSAKAGGAVCSNCAAGGSLALSPAGIVGIEALLARPLAEARDAGLAERSTRDALTVITAAYEYFGNFRLRTLRSA